MIKEAYCSKEVSILLKEKGFNEKCRGGYHYEFDDNDNPIVMLEEWTAQPYNNDFVDEGFLCSAPTHQLAMNWLREVHSTYIDIDMLSGITYWWSVYLLDKKQGETTISYDTYEDAVEAALEYVLENLI